jgi:hypothetical protein
MGELGRSRMVWLKGIGALIAGFVVIAAGSELTDVALQKLHVFPGADQPFTTQLYLIALLHRCLWGIAGCWVAARLAPRAPMLHALVLGGLGVVLNLLGMIAMWQVGDHWYPAALAVTALPCAWLGGILAGGRLDEARPA